MGTVIQAAGFFGASTTVASDNSKRYKIIGTVSSDGLEHLYLCLSPDENPGFADDDFYIHVLKSELPAGGLSLNQIIDIEIDDSTAPIDRPFCQHVRSYPVRSLKVVHTRKPYVPKP